jgi:hypothetical protein
MKARYKILLTANVFFSFLFILAAVVFESFLKEFVRNTDALAAIITVIVFIEFGIYTFLITIFLIALIALWWSRAKGNLEWTAAAKIQLVIVFLLIVMLPILFKL